MVIAAMQSREDIVHIRERAVGGIIPVADDLCVIAAMRPRAVIATADEMVDIGDVHPGFARGETGVDGKPHQAALRPGIGGTQRKNMLTVHVSCVPASLICSA